MAASFGSSWALGNGVVALTLLLAGWALPARGDSTFVYAVQVSAVVQVSPPQITLNWETDPYGANSYTVYRKAKEDTDWGSPLATLPGYVTSFTDTSVSVGFAYEYQIVKSAALGYYGFGYIYSGILVPPTENRGTVLLVVATNSTLGLDFELSRLHDDLVGDGWQVERFDVSSNDTPEAVHSLILDAYWANPSDVNSVFLLGHLPILQSGYLDYDGHGPRPMPADAYYGDVSYDWPTDPGNSPSYIPSDITLEVGRVDMANMPGKAAPVPWPTETELLRNYLNKDHNWRSGLVSVPRVALMGNRRGDEAGLATAASGYRNFEPLLGAGKTVEANISDTAPADQRWVSMLASGSYLWAYGCGAGQDTAIGYLGRHLSDDEVWSTDIVGEDAKAVFVLLFGSHFGNWDHPDNIMRAVLATPSLGLACGMSGEPHWFCHHMGLGETIGYSTRLSINNSTLYQSQMNTYTRAVYIALMGDPTLRMEPIRGPEALTISSDYAGVHLHWTASQDSVAGYYVYRSESREGPFTRVTGTLLSGTDFTDPFVPAGNYAYMVRAVAQVTNPSGSYFDPSEGALASVTVTAPPPPPRMTIHARISPAGLVLSWNAQPGASYHVESSSNFATPRWTDVSGPLSVSSSTLSWTNSAPGSSPAALFRVLSP